MEFQRQSQTLHLFPGYSPERYSHPTITRLWAELMRSGEVLGRFKLPNQPGQWFYGDSVADALHNAEAGYYEAVAMVIARYFVAEMQRT